MEVRLLDDQERWNTLALGCGMGNILQSYEWGEFKAGFGWEPVRVAVEDDGNLIAGVQLLIRRLPLGAVAYAPRGPLVNFSDTKSLDLLLAEAHAVARRRGAIFLKIEPEAHTSSSLEEALLRRGFVIGAAVQPRSTIVVDLAPDTETIASRLNAKTRYNIGLARRKGVTVCEGSAKDLEHFYRLLVETSRRSGFLVHSRSYYEAIWSTLEKRGMAQLLLAVYEGNPLAAAMIFVMGRRAYYMYGASSSEHRNLKPNDILQWECIKWAKGVGCRSYDLWGIPDEIGQALEEGREPDVPADDRVDGDGKARTMWGVYRFKRGFGGQVVRYAGAFDYVYSRARYWLYLASISRARPMLGIARAHQLSAAG